eukprot:m.421480 g.421480  ORF g.421480 m.421480 type:complete len:377 (+) comp34213_c0_seq1:66-1196(+)
MPAKKKQIKHAIGVPRQTWAWWQITRQTNTDGEFLYEVWWRDRRGHVSCTWEPSSSIPDIRAHWAHRYDFLESVEQVVLTAPGADVEGIDKKGKRYWIVNLPKERCSTAVRLAIATAVEKPGTVVTVPGIHRVRITREGHPEAQYEADESRKFYKMDRPEVETAENAALWQALVKADAQWGGDSVIIPGGAWDCTDRPFGLMRAPPSGGRFMGPNFPKVQFQFAVDRCVAASVLNATMLTDGERQAVLSMPPLSNMKDIAGFLRHHKVAIEMRRPTMWYPSFVTDPNFAGLLGYLLSSDSSGSIVANVLDIHGGARHYLLFDCDQRLIIDGSPRFGSSAHGLTAATIALMGIVRVISARKMVRQVRATKKRRVEPE